MLASTCLAMAIYFESRSEDLVGQYLVANTILNRVASKRFPNSVCGVVTQPKQFSFYWDGLPEKVTDKRSWNVAESIAEYSLKYHPSYFNGCFYQRKDLDTPWTKGYTSFTVGEHKFFDGGC